MKLVASTAELLLIRMAATVFAAYRQPPFGTLMFGSVQRTSMLFVRGGGIVVPRVRLLWAVVATASMMVYAAVAVAIEPLTPNALNVEERMLPLRGADLLSALRSRAEPPILTDVSVSLGGNYLTVASASIQPGHNNMRFWAQAIRAATEIHWRVWLIDVESGKRVELGGMRPNAEVYGSRLMPQWSPEGHRVALMESEGARFNLVEWHTNSPGIPRRTPLPDLTLGSGSAPKLYGWLWQAEEDTVVLEWTVPSAATCTGRTNPLRKDQETFSSWAWFFSRTVPGPTGKRARTEAVVRECMDPKRYRAIADLKRGTLSSLGNDEPIADRPQQIVQTRITTRDQRHVLISTKDSRLTSYLDEGLQMWLIFSKDPRARGLEAMQSTLQAVDKHVGAGQVIYKGGPGEIGAVAELASDEGFVIVEETPDLTVWPMRARYGRLRWIGSGGAYRDIPGEPIVFGASLHATSRRNAVFVWERGTPGNRLWEVNLSTGDRSRVGAAGRSITSLDVSADGRTVAAVIEGPGFPPEVAIWKEAEQRWRILTDFGTTKIRSPGEGKIQWISWRSKDNQFDFSGLLLSPSELAPHHRAPLVVCVNGGNFTGTAAQQDRYDPFRLGGSCGISAHVLAEAGYRVFMPNHRNVDGIGYLENRAIVGRYGAHVSQDIEAGVDALIGGGLADPDHLAIAGFSHGCDEVMYAIANSRRYKAAITNDGIGLLDYLVQMSSLDDDWHPAYQRHIMTRMLGFDPVQRNPRWADPFDIRTPLLFRVSGLVRETAAITDKDIAEPYAGEAWRAEAYALAYALSGNAVPFEIIIDRDWHMIDTPKYEIEFQSRVLQWLDYFVRNAGENPLPAMRSPLNYTEEFEANAAGMYARWSRNWRDFATRWQTSKKADSGEAGK